jgi:FAD/FMN-containing dehydrogenase
LRGNNNRSPELARKLLKKRFPLAVQLNVPSFVLNTMTVKAFNEAYYHVQVPKRVHKTISYDPFFYPLDSIHDWYRLYGKRGFLQYQFLVPFDNARDAMRDILRRIVRSGEGSFLTVLKKYGDIPSPGMLSFPRPGLNLALDFSYRGCKTLALLDDLDHMVLEAGGSVYPAKDAHMSAESFQTFFPQWKEFEQFIDPKFSSSFWRRVVPQPVSYETDSGPLPMPGL